MVTCKNCDNQFEGNYCPKCGQRVQTRFNFHYVIDEIKDILELDRGILYNFVNLTQRPGITIRSYIEGKTKPFYAPLSYFLLGMTLFILLVLDNFDKSQWSEGKVFIYDNYENLKSLIESYQKDRMDIYENLKVEDFEKQINNLKGFENMQNTSIEKMEKKANRSQAFTYLVFYFSPIYFAIFFWLFNLKNSWNFTEHFIIQTFIVAQFIWFTNVLALFIMIIYNFWNIGISANTAILGILIYLLGLLIFYFKTLKMVYRQNWFLTLIKGFFSLIIIGIFSVISILMVGRWITGGNW